MPTPLELRRLDAQVFEDVYGGRWCEKTLTGLSTQVLVPRGQPIEKWVASIQCGEFIPTQSLPSYSFIMHDSWMLVDRMIDVLGKGWKFSVETDGSEWTARFFRMERSSRPTTMWNHSCESREEAICRAALKARNGK